MMSGELRQRYTIRPSRILTAFLLLSSALLVALLYHSPLPFYWCLAGALGVLLAFGFVLLRDARLRYSKSWVAFELAPQGRLSLIPRKGASVQGKVDRSTFVTPYLVLLNTTTDSGKRHSVVIMPDSMGEADFRRLRVRLRWSGQA